METKLTRREILTGSVALGMLMRGRPGFAKASQPATPVHFDIPQHACDCHTHIFGDPAKFPFFSDPPYTPATAMPEEMSALHRTLHLERVVIVTPYDAGTDNGDSLYGMNVRGATA